VGRWLAAATIIGAYKGAVTTSMFHWAGVPNSISNFFTMPGFLIRLNSLILGKVVGTAAQAAVNNNK
jgi:hypothetical protein